MADPHIYAPNNQMNRIDGYNAGRSPEPQGTYDTNKVYQINPKPKQGSSGFLGGLYERLGSALSKKSTGYEGSMKQASKDPLVQRTVGDLVKGYDSGKTEAKKANPAFAQAMDNYRFGQHELQSPIEKSAENYISGKEAEHEGKLNPNVSEVVDRAKAGRGSPEMVNAYSGQESPEALEARMSRVFGAESDGGKGERRQLWQDNNVNYKGQDSSGSKGYQEAQRRGPEAVQRDIQSRELELQQRRQGQQYANDPVRLGERISSAIGPENTSSQDNKAYNSGLRETNISFKEADATKSRPEYNEGGVVSQRVSDATLNNLDYSSWSEKNSNFLGKDGKSPEPSETYGGKFTVNFDNPKPDLATAEERQRIREYLSKNRPEHGLRDLPGRDELDALRVYSEAAEKDRKMENMRRDAEANRDYLPDAARKEYERSPEEMNRFASDEKGSKKALEQYKSVHFPTDEQITARTVSRTLEGAEKVRAESYEKARAESADKFWKNMGNTEGHGYTSNELKDSAQESPTLWSKDAGLKQGERINDLQRADFEKSYRPPETGVAQGSGSASRQMGMRELYNKRLGDVRSGGEREIGKAFFDKNYRVAPGIAPNPWEEYKDLAGYTSSSAEVEKMLGIIEKAREARDLKPDERQTLADYVSWRDGRKADALKTEYLNKINQGAQNGAGLSEALRSEGYRARPPEEIRRELAEGTRTFMEEEFGANSDQKDYMTRVGKEGEKARDLEPGKKFNDYASKFRERYDNRTPDEIINDALKSSGLGPNKDFDYTADEKEKLGPKPQEGQDSQFWGKDVNYGLGKPQRGSPLRSGGPDYKMDESVGAGVDRIAKIQSYEKDWEKEMELLEKQGLAWDSYRNMETELLKKHGLTKQELASYDLGEKGSDIGEAISRIGEGKPYEASLGDEAKLRDLADKLAGEYRSMKDKFDKGSAPENSDYNRALGYEKELEGLGDEGKALLKRLQVEVYQHTGGAKPGLNEDGTLVNDFTRADLSGANSNIGKDGKYSLSGGKIKKDDLGDGLGYNAIRLTPEDQKGWASKEKVQSYMSAREPLRPGYERLDALEKLFEEAKNNTERNKIAVEFESLAPKVFSADAQIRKEHGYGGRLGASIADALVKRQGTTVDESIDTSGTLGTTAQTTNSGPAQAAAAAQ